MRRPETIPLDQVTNYTALASIEFTFHCGTRWYRCGAPQERRVAKAVIK